MRKFVKQVAKTAAEWKATCRSRYTPHNGKGQAMPKWLRSGFVHVSAYGGDAIRTDEIGGQP